MAVDDSDRPGRVLSHSAVHRIGVCTNDPIERATLVAVPVEATNEVPAVLVAEGDGHVLGGHLKLVDHVPASE